MYRPHSDTIENFTSTLDNLLSNNVFSNNSSILIGDFNINLMLDSYDVMNFVDRMRSHHYLQCITDVTHPGIIGQGSASLIDHIWINRL